MIKAIKYVDEVFIYNTEEDLYDWLNQNKWDVRILGSDWKGKIFTGHDIKGELYYADKLIIIKKYMKIIEKEKTNNYTEWFIY